MEHLPNVTVNASNTSIKNRYGLGLGISTNFRIFDHSYKEGGVLGMTPGALDKDVFMPSVCLLDSQENTILF